jgi:hypothetical protein
MTMRSGHGGRGLRSVPRGEEGQIGLVLLAMVAALLVGAVYIVQFGAKEEVSAKARTSADAAALAGAELGADQLLTWLLDGQLDLDLASGFGRERAAHYAERNGGTLTDYRVDSDGTVRVTVSVPRGDSGKVELERAAARIPIPVCTSETTYPSPPPSPSPTPTPSGSPSPTPAPSPSPSPTPIVTSSCSIGDLVVVLGRAIDTGDLRRALEPRLVSPN